jgi:hypothetical protein
MTEMGDNILIENNRTIFLLLFCPLIGREFQKIVANWGLGVPSPPLCNLVFFEGQKECLMWEGILFFIFKKTIISKLYFLGNVHILRDHGGGVVVITEG